MMEIKGYKAAQSVREITQVVLHRNNGHTATFLVQVKIVKMTQEGPLKYNDEP